MTRRHPYRPTPIYFLIGAMFLQGLSGLAGGIGLLSDPTGGNVEIPLAWLSGTPFDSYLIPGVILFYGGLGLFLVVLTMTPSVRGDLGADSLDIGLSDRNNRRAAQGSKVG